MPVFVANAKRVDSKFCADLVHAITAQIVASGPLSELNRFVSENKCKLVSKHP